MSVFQGNRKFRRIAVISDLHIPYHHPDSVPFLCAIKEKYEPDKWVCIGDEVDKHGLNFHGQDPDLLSAGDELLASREILQDFYSLIPELDILESNHGSLAMRKAFAAGIPKAYMKTYREVLGAPDKWRWHMDLCLRMSDGNLVYFHHGKVSDVMKLSQNLGMSAVQGHYHNSFQVRYWGSPVGLFWGLQVGCLIDDKALAFNYNKVTLKRPIIGMGIIIDGQPHLLPMVLDKDGRWNGLVP